MTLKFSLLQQGITCVVQCSNNNNKSNHRVGISLHESLASGPEMEKGIMFVLTHSANLNLRGIFVGCSDHFTDECFQRAVPVEGSRRSIIPLSIPTIWKKDPEKTRRKVPNLNAVEVIVVSFATHPPLCKTYFRLTYFKIYFSCGKPFQFCRLLARRSSVQSSKNASWANAGPSRLSQ